MSIYMLFFFNDGNINLIENFETKYNTQHFSFVWSADVYYLNFFFFILGPNNICTSKNTGI